LSSRSTKWHSLDKDEAREFTGCKIIDESGESVTRPGARIMPPGCPTRFTVRKISSRKSSG
jgi:hypothetical protein